ncbi:hypothetical protein BpHYR1_010423, partial [Brachionus plicatilis]
GEEEIDPGMVINHVVLQEMEVNEAQLEDESVRTLFKWLTSGEKPVKCSKDGPDLYIYWCNFRDFRIFGKNVYRCYDKSECGVHFQYVTPTSAAHVRASAPVDRAPEPVHRASSPVDRAPAPLKNQKMNKLYN